MGSVLLTDRNIDCYIDDLRSICTRFGIDGDASIGIRVSGSHVITAYC